MTTQEKRVLKNEIKKLRIGDIAEIITNKYSMIDTITHLESDKIHFAGGIVFDVSSNLQNIKRLSILLRNTIYTNSI